MAERIRLLRSLAGAIARPRRASGLRVPAWRHFNHSASRREQKVLPDASSPANRLDLIVVSAMVAVISGLVAYGVWKTLSDNANIPNPMTAILDLDRLPPVNYATLEDMKKVSPDRLPWILASTRGPRSDPEMNNCVLTQFYSTGHSGNRIRTPGYRRRHLNGRWRPQDTDSRSGHRSSSIHCPLLWHIPGIRTRSAQSLASAINGKFPLSPTAAAAVWRDIPLRPLGVSAWTLSTWTRSSRSMRKIWMWWFSLASSGWPWMRSWSRWASVCSSRWIHVGNRLATRCDDSTPVDHFPQRPVPRLEEWLAAIARAPTQCIMVPCAIGSSIWLWFWSTAVSSRLANGRASVAPDTMSKVFLWAPRVQWESSPRSR